jgi:hypothetical protein
LVDAHTGFCTGAALVQRLAEALGSISGYIAESSHTNRLTNEEAKPMARKPNYEFERRERDRLKMIKNAEKAAAKKEAKERAKAEAGAAAAPAEVGPDEKT